jgi:hypothetical protein
VDPLWALLADVWWIAPAAAGAGAVGWAGVRMNRGSGRARRLELEAARHDVRAAYEALTRARAGVLSARAAVARADADRVAGRGTGGEASAARRALAQAERDVRAAYADLRARRAGVRAARAAVPPARAGRDALPLSRLMAEHDALRRRWVAYETDAGKAIDYPLMSDPQHPLTAEFLRAQAAAQWLRPANAQVKMRPADFAAYRDAVRAAERAFGAAEREARRAHGDPVESESPTDRWSDLARDVMDSTSRAIARSAEAVARAAESGWKNRKRPPTE